MFCTKCGKKVDDGAKFCNHCGQIISNNLTNKSNIKISQPEENIKKTINEAISFIIDNIKYSGVASIEYWIIVFTDRAIYFCNTKSNYGYGVLGAVNDLMHNNKAKGETDINSILSRSKRYYRFEKEQLMLINYKNGFIKNKIIIDTGKGKIKIKINSKKYNQFVDQLKIFK